MMPKQLEKQITPQELADLFIVLVVYFFFAHVVDAIVTYFVARKGLNPRTGSIS